MKKHKLNPILLSERLLTALQQPKLIGFHRHQTLAPYFDTDDYIVLDYDEEKHLITFASTGSGKSRCAIIPNLLLYDGPVVVFDPKGELYAVTARARREMGHKTVLLDPFNIVKGEKKKDSLNLLDMLQLSDEPHLEAQTLAYNLSGKGFSSDPYWDECARSLLSSVIGYIWYKNKESERNMQAVLQFVFCEDLTYKIAVILDTDKSIPSSVADGFKTYLQIPGEKTRPCVDSTLFSYLHILNSHGVLKALNQTSFELNDFIKGKPLDIYVAFPPDKMESHSRLFLQWILLLMRAIVSRSSIPKNNTLFILDEAATLGENKYFSNFLTQCRGYGARIWTFWQDMQQLIKNYQSDHKTIINNCGVIQIFGVHTHHAAAELSLLTNIRTDIIRKMSKTKQIIIIEEKEYLLIDKPDYLNDPLFEGKFDPNPLHKGK